MSEEYTQLKDIKLKDILDLTAGSFRDSCISQLLACGFIKKIEPEWQEITLRDLHKIRAGVTVKQIVDAGESIIHVTSDPYWSSWQDSKPLDHILVCAIARDSGHGNLIRGVNEYSINDLFNGKVYIQE